MLRLIRPTMKYKASYIEAQKEFLQESQHHDVLKDVVRDFEKHVTDIKNSSSHIEYWLMNGNQYVGSIQIRYKPSGKYPEIKSHIYYEIRPSQRKRGYGQTILALGLQKAKQLMMKRLIITCHVENIPSRLIIEKNGGVLTESVNTPEGVILKYSISL